MTRGLGLRNVRWLIATAMVAIAVSAALPVSRTEAQEAALPASAPAPAHTNRREPDMSPRAAEVYAQTGQMMRRMQEPGVAVEMLDALVPVVRQHRHPLLVGRLVVAAAAVASSGEGRTRVDKLIAAAGEAPDDDIAAFVAGVAVHYRGHVRGASRATKSADYKRAITLLEPLKARLAASPRLWIYLAVSYLRTGRQAEAEDAIAHAVEVDSGGDADVYYCRAEVYHRKDPARALADINTYVSTMQHNRAHGAWSAPGKEQLVLQMREHFAAVAAGTSEPGGVELFDPVRDPAPPPPNRLLEFAWWIVGGAALIVAVLWVRRLTR